jgi:hypothetical protein
VGRNQPGRRGRLDATRDSHSSGLPTPVTVDYLARMRTRLRVRLLVAFAAVTAACAAGRTRSPYTSQFPLLPGDSRVLHAVQSVQLRDAMDNLERITTSKLPETLGRDAERRSDLEEIATLADTLGRSAAEIPEALSANDVPPDEERRFRELAEQLVRDSFALRDRAILGEVGSARDETEQLLATCNACHAMSRVPPMVPNAATRVAAAPDVQQAEHETPQPSSRSRDARRRAKPATTR